MAYCTQADVQIAVGGLAKLIELTDQDNLTGAVVVAVVDKAIADADAEINSYIAHRKAVPVFPVPPILTKRSAQWAARILRANLYNGQPLQDDLEREEIDRKWLDGIARGVYSLGIDPDPTPSATLTDKTSTRDPSLLVSRLRLRGYS